MLWALSGKVTSILFADVSEIALMSISDLLALISGSLVPRGYPITLVIKVFESSSSISSPKAALLTASICSYNELTSLNSSSVLANLDLIMVYSFSSLLTDSFRSLFFLFCWRAEVWKNLHSECSTSNFFFHSLISALNLSFYLS